MVPGMIVSRVYASAAIDVKKMNVRSSCRSAPRFSIWMILRCGVGKNGIRIVKKKWPEGNEPHVARVTKLPAVLGGQSNRPGDSVIAGVDAEETLIVPPAGGHSRRTAPRDEYPAIRIHQQVPIHART